MARFRPKLLPILLGAGCSAGVSLTTAQPAAAIQYVFTSAINGGGNTNPGATYVDTSSANGGPFNGFVRGSFDFVGGVFSNVSVTANCFDGASGQGNPCDVFGPSNNTNTVTFIGTVVDYNGSNQITFKNSAASGTDVLRIIFAGGALVNAPATRNLTASGSYFCSSSGGGSPNLTCAGDEQARFTTFTGSLRAVPTPLSALALLPVACLSFFRKRYSTLIAKSSLSALD